MKFTHLVEVKEVIDEINEMFTFSSAEDTLNKTKFALRKLEDTLEMMESTKVYSSDEIQEVKKTMKEVLAIAELARRTQRFCSNYNVSIKMEVAL